MQDFRTYVPLEERVISRVCALSLVSHLTWAVAMDCGSWLKTTKYSTTDALEKVSLFCGVFTMHVPPGSTVGLAVGVAVTVAVPLGVAVGVAVAWAVAVGVIWVVGCMVAPWSSCFSCRHPAKNAKAIAMRRKVLFMARVISALLFLKSCAWSDCAQEISVRLTEIDLSKSFSFTVITTLCCPSDWPDTLNVALNGAFSPTLIFEGQVSVTKLLSEVHENVLSSRLPVLVMV